MIRSSSFTIQPRHAPSVTLRDEVRCVPQARRLERALNEGTHMNVRLLGQTCCTTTPAAMGFWGAVFVLVYGAGILAGSFWPSVGQYGDTVILAALGMACFANF